MQSQPPSSLMSFLLPLIIVGVVLLLRTRRMAVERPFNLGTLWVIPAVFLVIAVFTLVEFPPQGVEFLWLGLALILGVALGWQRGRLMSIRLDPESGRLMTKGSGWAIIFLFALFVIRSLLRTGLNMEAQAGVITPGLINNVFVLFAFGLFATQRAEMALRAKRLKDGHPDMAIIGGEDRQQV
ncbi:MAG: CcdC protein domain-containing protein [Sphingomonadaceae bacterium]